MRQRGGDPLLICWPAFASRYNALIRTRSAAESGLGRLSREAGVTRGDSRRDLKRTRPDGVRYRLCTCHTVRRNKSSFVSAVKLAAPQAQIWRPNGNAAPHNRACCSINQLGQLRMLLKMRNAALRLAYKSLVSSVRRPHNSDQVDWEFPVGVKASVSLTGAFRFLATGKSSVPSPRSPPPDVRARRCNRIFVSAPRMRGSPAPRE